MMVFLPDVIGPGAATAVIHYRLNGVLHTWGVGCHISDTQETLQAHLEHWIPDAEFIHADVTLDAT